MTFQLTPFGEKSSILRVAQKKMFFETFTFTQTNPRKKTTVRNTHLITSTNSHVPPPFVDDRWGPGFRRPKMRRRHREVNHRLDRRGHTPAREGTYTDAPNDKTCRPRVPTRLRRTSRKGLRNQGGILFQFMSSTESSWGTGCRQMPLRCSQGETTGRVGRLQG